MINLTQSKLGTQGFQSGSFVSIAFTRPSLNSDKAKVSNVLVGVGIGSIAPAQAHNVEPTYSLGYADIVEHVSHGVRSNTLQIQKAMLVHRLLGDNIAQWGMDNFTAPTLNAIIYNSFWSQAEVAAAIAGEGGFAGLTLPGTKNLELLYCHGLHLSMNSLDITAQQTVRENVQFMVDRFKRYSNEDSPAYAKALFSAAQKMAGKAEFYTPAVSVGNIGSAQAITPNALTL
jgi:hypothetical protein